MADLTITGARLVREIEGYDWVVGENLDAGQYARLNTTTSKAELGNASSAAEVGVLGGIVTNPDRDAGRTAHITVIGIVDVGDALAGLTYGDSIFLSNTDGTFADTAGTVSTVVATVIPAWTSTTADKLLFITGVNPS